MGQKRKGVNIQHCDKCHGSYLIVLEMDVYLRSHEKSVAESTI